MCQTAAGHLPTPAVSFIENVPTQTLVVDICLWTVVDGQNHPEVKGDAEASPDRCAWAAVVAANRSSPGFK